VGRDFFFRFLFSVFSFPVGVFFSTIEESHLFEGEKDGGENKKKKKKEKKKARSKQP